MLVYKKTFAIVGFLYLVCINILFAQNSERKKKAYEYLALGDSISSPYENKYYIKADDYYQRALEFYKNEKYNEASEYLIKSKIEELNSKTLRREKLKTISYSLNEIGMILFNTSNYNDATKIIKEALEVAMKLELNKDVSTMLQNLGFIYNSLGKYDKAIKNFSESLEVNRALGIENSIAASLIYIGFVNYNWGKYDEALKNYEEALVIFRRLGSNDSIAASLVGFGLVYKSLGKNEVALKYYKESLLISRRLDSESEIASTLNKIGQVYYDMSKLDEALKHFEEAVKIERKLGGEDNVAIYLNNMALVYKKLGNHQEIIRCYEESLEINRRLKNEEDIVTSLMGIGQVYNSSANYEKVLKYFEEALEINRRLGKENDIATCLFFIGLIYDNWGIFDEALKYFEESLEISRKLDNENDISVSLIGIGQVYNSWGKYEESLKHSKEALKIARNDSNEVGVAISISIIRQIYSKLGKYEEALRYTKELTEIIRRLGSNEKILSELATGFGIELGIADLLNKTGIAYYLLGNKYDEALKYFDMALEAGMNLGSEEDIANSLSNLGSLYFVKKEYDKGVNYLINSIDIIEKIRKTAPGEIRRDYLESQIHNYGVMINIYQKMFKNDSSLFYYELSKSKFLAEEISKDTTGIRIDKNELLKLTNNNSSFLVFANTSWQDKIQFVVKEKIITGREYNDSSFAKEVINIFSNNEKTELANLRGAKITKIKDDDKLSFTGKDTEFESIINYYHSLLMNPAADNKNTIDKISRELYKLLIEPVEKELKGKKEIIIVSDGILSLIPFETLLDSTGKYLAEKYNIKYSYSLSVLKLLQDREYSDDKRELLAVGGAVYNNERKEKNTEAIKNDVQLAYLKSEVNENISGKRSAGFAYDQLGYGSWSNLPGTEKEVNEIGKIVGNSKIIKGTEVTEELIKELSTKGELKNYKILHFATHGITVPEIPELSAIVLSQFEEEREEDGYLTMKEIVDLDIEAKFVNLSACETGLGKIYSGEGVVGLTQSFLIAGANGLSVSLWQVADESTALFMTEMYRLVEKEEMDYSVAMNEIKRSFIKGKYGEKYKHPFYWAPFVYYGK